MTTDEVTETIALLEQASRDAVTTFNDAGLPCPASIALAVEKARNALREVANDRDGYQQTFDLRWKADMRAMSRWRKAHPGNELVWPDHADLVVWLLDRERTTQ